MRSCTFQDSRNSTFFIPILSACIIGLMILTGCKSKYVERPSGYNDPDSVKTAVELLAELEKEVDWTTDQWGRSSNLPKEEVEIVAKELRARYPVVSIRDRLHFQASHPQPVVRTPSGQGRNYRDGFLSQRSRALSELHSNEVHNFINRNGQGMMRSPPPAPSDLRLWENFATHIDSEEVDSMLLGEPVIDLPPEPEAEGDNDYWQQRLAFSPTGMPTQTIVDFFHQTTAYGFANPTSTGFVENVDEVTGFESHQVRLPEKWQGNLRIIDNKEYAKEHLASFRFDVSWKVNRLQLVGLLMHDDPVVYETETLPDMEELSGADAETRPLNLFEANALEKLRAGEEIVTTATHNRIIMLGAIRAGVSCVQCHSVEKNELLGAFSYEFLRDPREEPAIQTAF